MTDDVAADVRVEIEKYYPAVSELAAKLGAPVKLDEPPTEPGWYWFEGDYKGTFLANVVLCRITETPLKSNFTSGVPLGRAWLSKNFPKTGGRVRLPKRGDG